MPRKTEVYQFRTKLSDHEKLKIQQYCGKHNITQQDFFRAAVLAYLRCKQPG
jgi:hypothetical protein